jgi:5-methylcytosine-specific restriction endonuclease McrA
MVTTHAFRTKPLCLEVINGWLLRAFVQWANADKASTPEDKTLSLVIPRTPREPSLRLRFLVMQRDNFKCRCCGASPAMDSSVGLHVDHIKAWSKGGLTVLQNLQTLCTKCNLGKSDLSMDGS